MTGITRSNPTDLYAWTGHYNINRAYGTNGLNQLTSAGATALGYDGRGNLTSSGSSQYTYTSENRLATAPGGMKLTYDPTGRLSRLTQGGVTLNQFEHLGPRLIAERNASGNILRRYVHGPGDDEPVVWYEGSSLANKRFLHTDERRSVIAVTDATGASIATNKYDEYGIPQSSVALAPGTSGRFLYTGQMWIPELGLYYYKARFYSPTLGRFMQTDPIGYKDGINWYAYVGNDPVNGRDPTGLAQCKGDSRCAAAHQAAAQAKAGAEAASGRLKDLAKAIKGGGELTEQQSSDKTAFEGKFGEDSATTKNLGKVAGVFDKIANKIGEQGQGMKVQFGASEGVASMVLNSNKMTLSNAYWDSSGNYTGRLSLSFVLRHEAGHGVGIDDLVIPQLKALGFGRQTNAGYRAYGHGASNWLAANNPGKALKNNDNYQCFADPTCGD